MPRVKPFYRERKKQKKRKKLQESDQPKSIVNVNHSLFLVKAVDQRVTSRNSGRCRTMSSDDEDPQPVTDPPPFFASMLSGIAKRLPESVYPPSDDTFLVLQTFLNDNEELRRRR